MVSATTSGFTSVCTANGRMVPAELPAVGEGSVIRAALDLRPLLGTDTISGTFTVTDEPSDLTITNSARINTNTGVAFDVSGFKPGVRYTVQLSATLTSGAVINKSVAINCPSEC